MLRTTMIKTDKDSRKIYSHRKNKKYFKLKEIAHRDNYDIFFKKELEANRIEGNVEK